MVADGAASDPHGASDAIAGAGERIADAARVTVEEVRRCRTDAERSCDTLIRARRGGGRRQRRRRHRAAQ
ncbi:hypothetical protein [Azospirillum halopraeferens]|uniref:hypothetical protein n=1 Tax=Azospirillum halopraeferens TaxID=34010 RepID=UPI0003F6D453|nr:hypothetical protein [Azospirillum halopraeferens]